MGRVAKFLTLSRHLMSGLEDQAELYRALLEEALQVEWVWDEDAYKCYHCGSISYYDKKLGEIIDAHQSTCVHHKARRVLDAGAFSSDDSYRE